MENRNVELNEQELQNVNGGSVEQIIPFLDEDGGTMIELINQLKLIEKQNQNDARLKEEMDALRKEMERKKQNLEL